MFSAIALAKGSRLAQTLGKREERGCKPRPAWQIYPSAAGL